MGMPKPWKTSEWKEKRKKLIKGKKCEWCGSTKGLSIHHKKKKMPYRTHYRLVSNRLLKKLINEGTYKTISKKACPRCHSSSIYLRKTLTPKFRCIKCAHTFDRPIKQSTSSVSRGDYADFQSKNKEIIKEIVRSERQQSYEEYMTLKDTRILCKKCHLAIEKGRVLCQVCKKKYHKRRYRKCWHCFNNTKKEKRLVA